MLTELVSMLVAVSSQNAANVTPAIPPEIRLADMEGEEAQPPQEGRDVTASEARIDTSSRRRCAQHKRRNATQTVRGDHKPTIESH